jgi:hypothetical protein
MVNSLMQTLKSEYLGSGFSPRSKKARDWFLDKIKSNQFGKINPNKVMNDPSKKQQPLGSAADMIGSMYFFWYDAKLKGELPYWDMFPLVLPIDFHKNGILGLNLHYLDYTHRALLLDRLSDFSNNKRFDKTTKLKLSYSLLAGTTRYSATKPCIKKYLYPHISSKFIAVDPSVWDMAIFLPVERFVGSSKTQVWSESKKKI